ncbi:MAG: SpoIIE family protein phosphatase [candidate division Zixibacteria bacterium]|nr:SpoIIE family protein phosphatase [candidate division Zixibacteria bacterium]
MPEKKDLILDILSGAIQREISAYDYYYKSSESSPFQETRSLFLQLAREEKKHREILIKEYQTVKRMLLKEKSDQVYLEKEEVSYFIPEEIIPRKTRTIPELDLSSVSLPTEFLGGDYFETLIVADPFKNINHLGFLLYDIMGHGLELTTLKAQIREKFENLQELWSKDRSILSPASTLSRLGKALFPDCQRASSFVELFYALYDPLEKKITYSSAGHPPPLLISNQGKEVKVLIDTDLVMGIAQAKEYRDSYMKVESGDILILSSDGVVEAFNPEEEFYGDKRLIQTVRENFQLSSIEITNRICKSIKEFTGERPLTDELTLVIAKIK